MGLPIIAIVTIVAVINIVSGTIVKIVLVCLFVCFHIIKVSGLMNNLKLQDRVNELKGLGIPGVRCQC